MCSKGNTYLGRIIQKELLELRQTKQKLNLSRLIKLKLLKSAQLHEIATRHLWERAKMVLALSWIKKKTIVEEVTVQQLFMILDSFKIK